MKQNGARKKEMKTSTYASNRPDDPDSLSDDSAYGSLLRACASCMRGVKTSEEPVGWEGLGVGVLEEDIVCLGEECVLI